MMLTVVSTSTCQTAEGYINQRPDTFQMFHIEPLYIQNLRMSRKKTILLCRVANPVFSAGRFLLSRVRCRPVM
jgi:hypothetical protein